jgi:hypothetical protein
MSKTAIFLTDEQVKQILWAIDLVENTLEGLTAEDLDRLGIEIDKGVLFALASELEGKGN